MIRTDQGSLAGTIVAIQPAGPQDPRGEIMSTDVIFVLPNGWPEERRFQAEFLEVASADGLATMPPRSWTWPPKV